MKKGQDSLTESQVCKVQNTAMSPKMESDSLTQPVAPVVLEEGGADHQDLERKRRWPTWVPAHNSPQPHLPTRRTLTWSFLSSILLGNWTSFRNLRKN